MRGLSNIPPGCTNRAIEDAQGGTHSDEYVAALYSPHVSEELRKTWLEGSWNLEGTRTGRCSSRTSNVKEVEKRLLQKCDAGAVAMVIGWALLIGAWLWISFGGPLP